MCEHTYLPAMVGFVRKHVAQHFRANWPGASPSVPQKCPDAASFTAERFREHFGAANCALGQSLADLLRRTVRAAELGRNLQVRSRKPYPLRANIVHVREDRCDAADSTRRFGPPYAGVKMFDKKLVHALIRRKDPDRGAAELSANLGLIGSGSINLGSIDLGSASLRLASLGLTRLGLARLGLTRGHRTILLDLRNFDL
jgi:hypothetical protein